MGGGIETIPKTVILGQSSCLMTRFYKGESSTSIWNASFQRMNEILLFHFLEAFMGGTQVHAHTCPPKYYFSMDNVMHWGKCKTCS